MKRSRPTWPTRSSKRRRRVKKRNEDAGLTLLTLATALVGAGWLLRRTWRAAEPSAEPVPVHLPVPRPGGTSSRRRRIAVLPSDAAPLAPDEVVALELQVYEHFSYGMELLDAGNPAQAAVRLEKARAGAPGKASIHEALGRAYFDLNRLKDAEGEFRAVVRIAPTNDYAHFALARVLERTGRFKEAHVHRKLAQAMRPDEERYRR